MATMIKVPLTFKEEELAMPFSDVATDGRVLNVVLRYFAARGIIDPTVEQVFDEVPNMRNAKGLGKTSFKKLLTNLMDVSITSQTDEQLLNNALDFVVLNQGVLK